MPGSLPGSAGATRRGLLLGAQRDTTLRGEEPPRTSRAACPSWYLNIPHRQFSYTHALAPWGDGVTPSSLLGQRSDLAPFTARWGEHEGQGPPGPQTRPVQEEGFLGRISRGLGGQLPGASVPEGRPSPSGGAGPWGRALGRKRAARLGPSRPHPSALSLGCAVT